MRHLSLSRSLRCRLLAAAILLVFAVPGLAGAAELLMFEQAGCPFCRNFDREIAPGYADSRFGRIAPLRRVDIHVDRRGGISDLIPAVFTPTFVLIDDAGREVGRLEGYPGEKWFYPEIAEIFGSLEGGSKGAGMKPRPGSFRGKSPAPE